MTAALHRPNGLCFSPDETLLYVADSGGLWGPTFDEEGAHHVMVFDVIDGGEHCKTAWAVALTSNRDVACRRLCIDCELNSAIAAKDRAQLSFATLAAIVAGNYFAPFSSN